MYLKKALIPMVAIVLAAGSFTAKAETSQMTKDFVNKAAVGNMFEIESSRVALETSHNDPTKEFAQEMIDAHGEAGQNMKEAVAESGTGITLPADLDAKHEDKLAALKAADETQIDGQYLKMQNEAHEMSIKLYEDYASNGDNEALKTYAAETLPVLKDHKKHLEGLAISP